MFNYRIKVGKPACLGVTKCGKGINFAVAVRDGKPCSLILYPKGSKEAVTEIRFTKDMQFGDIYAMFIGQLPIQEYEYNYCVDGVVMTDPYAREIRKQETVENSLHGAASGLEYFSWQGDTPLKLPYEECVLYITHPKGFTKDVSSRVKHPGTFAGIREKIPYLKKLGINQLELMPVYELKETNSDLVPQKHKPIPKTNLKKVNYWGYGDAWFFAPRASYSASGNPVREMKELVRELHKNGIELILEFYFPWLTSPRLIIDCIKYWVQEYHIDGVHINCEGTPLTELSWEPELAYTKIMSEYFALNQIYQPDYRPSFRNLAEYNDDFLVKSRCFLKGDKDMLGPVAECMRKNPKQQAVINYIANHNGFTLLDTVSYNMKHNKENGEDNQDGSDYNYSFNYGEEGPATKIALKKLRRKQIRNALLMVILSQGVPAIYGGDEMGNSQKGNNNVYCQDNELAWVQWGRKREARQMQDFVRDAITFRKRHAAFGRRDAYTMKDFLSKGVPDLSYHGKQAWYGEFESGNRHIGILYTGDYTKEETLYVLYNMHGVEHELALPTLPPGQQWYLAADTGREKDAFLPEAQQELLKNQKMVVVPPRTIFILVGGKDETN